MGYLRPVDPTNGRISSYSAHTHRTTPSLEAGVDYYCPIGTPIRAAGDGVIFETGGGIAQASGRYVTLDLDDGRRVRYLHLSRWGVYRGRVSRGQVIGYSGASGYGSEFFGASSLARIPANTGGPHVHTTLWDGHYYQFGRYPIEPTLDFELYVSGGTAAGGGSTPLEDDLNEDQSAKLNQITAQVAELMNLMKDPETGVWSKGIPEIRGNVANAAAWAGNANSIAGEIRNLIVDPTNGVLVSIGRVSGGGVDVGALAAQIREGLGDEVADELARRLSS